jgi:uncharacterized Rossmann fold enzyme
MSEEREHVAARIREALATDPRVGEIELEIMVGGSEVVVHGTVPTEDRRRAVDEVLQEVASELRVRNEVTITSHREPREQDEEAVP